MAAVAGLGTSGKPIVTNTFRHIYNTNKFRLLFGLLIVTYFAILGIGGALIKDYHGMWGRMGVPIVEPAFSDLHVITNAIDRTRQDPREDIYNSAFLARRNIHYNYPKAWLLLSIFGITDSQAFVCGTILAVVLFCVFFSIFAIRSVGEALLLALALCSPAIMLLVERGNSDAIIFIGFALALVLLLRRKLWARSLGYGLIVILAFLKLYPVCAFVVALKERRQRAALVMLSCSVLFLVYLILIRSQISSITQNTPEGTTWSYGARVLPRTLIGLMSPAARSPIEHFPVARFVQSTVLHIVPQMDDTKLLWVRHSVDMIVLVIVGIVTVAVGFRSVSVSSLVRFPTVPAGFTKDAFRIGASIYLGTFLLTISWHYRLVFVLFTMPQLFEWCRERSYQARWARVAILSFVATAWIGRVSFWFNCGMDELLDYALYFSLVVLLARDIAEELVGARTSVAITASHSTVEAVKKSAGMVTGEQDSQEV